ncbi:MAG: serine/threonine-protein kinase [Gemmatimonadales bacterium]
MLGRICPSCNTPLPEMAAFCYICGSATPIGIDPATGEMTVATASHETSIHRLKKALGKDYEIGRLVGRGGFAEVFQVRDLRLKRDLALKALRPDLMLSDVMVMRFRREAESAAQLRHPNIVPIYDVGEAENIAFILMPLVEGESLKAMIEREGAVPPPEARRIMLEAASALATAHEAGVVHRDIKPENIMLEGRKRRVLLMDFGIAKAVDPAAAEQEGDIKAQPGTLTGTGMTVGTPQYMSPEQASGDYSIDHRADQYSLAVVGYQMLTGLLPFDGENTRTILYKQMVETPKPVRELAPDVPADLAQAIERALSKEPKDRYPTTDAFAHALSGPPSGVQTPVTVSVTSQMPVRRISKKRRSGAYLMGLGGLVVAAAVVWALQARDGSPSATDLALADSVATADSLAALAAAGGTLGTAGAPPIEAPAGPSTDTRPAAERPLTPPPAAARPTPTTAAPAVAQATCATAARESRWAEALDLCAAEGGSGSANAARILGTLYEFGRGTPASFPDAAAWYTTAASAGDAEGKFRLAELYRAGRGVPQNLAQAQTLYREAAEAGLAMAYYPLATLFEEGGRGARRDEAEAVVWYRRAAEGAADSARAQGKVGDMYARGRGVRRDEAEAYRWLLRGAQSGDSWSQFQAGQALLRGRGVARNDSLGWVWVERSAAQGFQEARRELERRPAGGS